MARSFCSETGNQIIQLGGRHYMALPVSTSATTDSQLVITLKNLMVNL